ncbi:hypothetical protein [Sphingomonas sp. MMS24-J13]|uniref:hypothetical protein n=1 Tax=Sphingomonas sp. MMS24-J13 TaxID=3238686 RepID=UPI00384D430B
MLAYQAHQLAAPQFYPFLRYSRRFAAKGIHFRALPADALTAASLPPNLDALFLQSTYTPAKGNSKICSQASRLRSPI